MVKGFVLPGGSLVKFEDAPKRLIGIMPEALIYSLLENIQSPRPKGITVTMLTTPCLRKSYFQATEDYFVPIEDSYWSSYRGSMIHLALAKLKEYKPEYIIEERIEKEISGVSISGKMDLYKPDSKTLVDYKTCAQIYTKYLPHADHKFQTEVYRFLLEPEHPVEKIQIAYLDGSGWATVKYGKSNLIQLIQAGETKFIGLNQGLDSREDVEIKLKIQLLKLNRALTQNIPPPASPCFLCDGKNKKGKIYCPFKIMCK